MKKLFLWILGIGGFFLVGRIAGPSMDPDNPVTNIYEGIGRYIVGLGLAALIIYIIYKAGNTSSDKKDK